MDIPPKSVPLSGEATPSTSTKKRGRPAGTTNQIKSNSEVEQALATLETAYQFIALGLTMVGAPNAGSELANKIEMLQEQNRSYLTADRKLAQTISKVGSASGRAGFVITNFMAFAPVVMTAVGEISSRRAEMETEIETETKKTETKETVTTAPVSTYQGSVIRD